MHEADARAICNDSICRVKFSSFKVQAKIAVALLSLRRAVREMAAAEMKVDLAAASGPEISWSQNSAQTELC